MDLLTSVYIAAESVVGLITFVGNLLVLVAIARNHRLRTVTNCFIASLATADMLVGLVVAPLAGASLLGWPHHFLGCVFTNSALIAFTQVSIFNLLAVAVERFMAIKHPFAYRKYLTIPMAVGINAAVCSIGLLFGFIPVFGWNLRDQMTDDWFCGFDTTIDVNYVVYFHFFACTVIPLLIIIAVYCYIFRVVRKQLSQIAALDISVPNQTSRFSTLSKFKREIKAAKSLAFVILLFALCWIPLHVLNVYNITCGVDCYPFELMLVTIVLSHANSAVNPFLYAYGNNSFKSTMKRMLCRVNDRDQISSEPSQIDVSTRRSIPKNAVRTS